MPGADEPGVPPEPLTPPGRPGASVFTIEGRAAPGLFVVGWLLTLAGFGAVIVALLAGRALSGSILFVVGLAALSLGLVAGAGSQAIERRARGRADYAGPSPVLVFLAAIPITTLIGVGLGTALLAAGIEVDGPVGLVLTLLITALVYWALVRLLVVGTGALRWRDMGLGLPGHRIARDFAWGVVLAGPILLGTGILAALLLQVLPRPPDVLPPTFDATGLILNLVAAAVLAPIGEELFFRGFATTAWLRTNGERGAVVRGAIFFAAAHTIGITAADASEGLGMALVAFVVRLPVAVVLCLLYVRTRSLYGPIGLHATFNALPVLAAAALASSG